MSQPLLGGSRTPGAPKMRVLPIAKTLSRMQSCFAVFWMQSMQIFLLFQISIMDGWMRKADGSECRVQGGGLKEFPELRTVPREGGLMPSSDQLQAKSIGYRGN